MTLSRFFKDFVYIPLGGNRKNELNTHINILITFSICGLWHGAGWLFVFWGICHGAALMVFRLWGHTNTRLPTFLSWLLTFNFLNVTWIFFRAKDWESAFKVLNAMFNFSIDSLSNEQFLVGFGANSIENLYVLIVFLISAAIIMKSKNSNEILSNITKKNIAIGLPVFLFSLSLLAIGSNREFIYFVF